MSQNQAAFVAKAAAGGLAPLNLDAAGNLMVTTDVTPADITTLQASSGNQANTAAVATLAKATGKTVYITGLLISYSGATAAGNATCTISGLLGGSMTFNVPVPAGAGVPGSPIRMNFDPPLPASAVNTDVVVTVGALGGGNTFSSVAAWGFRQ